MRTNIPLTSFFFTCSYFALVVSICFTGEVKSPYYANEKKIVNNNNNNLPISIARIYMC